MAQVEAILAKSKITTAEVAKVEQLLDKAQASGVISAGELAAAFKALDEAKVKDIALTKAQTAANKGAMNSRTQYELGVLLGEGASGNTSRIKRSVPALLNSMHLTEKLFTPAGLGFGLVAASLGTYAVAAYKAESRTLELNKAILATGGAAGVTTGELSAMAVALSDGRRSGAEIHDALVAVASSGKFAGDQIQTVAKAALDMADVTGQSVQ